MGQQILNAPPSLPEVQWFSKSYWWNCHDKHLANGRPKLSDKDAKGFLVPWLHWCLTLYPKRINHTSSGGCFSQIEMLSPRNPEDQCPLLVDQKWKCSQNTATSLLTCQKSIRFCRKFEKTLASSIWNMRIQVDHGHMQFKTVGNRDE